MPNAAAAANRLLTAIMVASSTYFRHLTARGIRYAEVGFCASYDYNVMRGTNIVIGEVGLIEPRAKSTLASKVAGYARLLIGWPNEHLHRQPRRRVAWQRHR